ncbi:hypothetical protein PFISCL1PPCAC_26308, partial [Pristionchus fissidentatus]
FSYPAMPAPIVVGFVVFAVIAAFGGVATIVGTLTSSSEPVVEDEFVPNLPPNSLPYLEDEDNSFPALTTEEFAALQDPTISVTSPPAPSQTNVSNVFVAPCLNFNSSSLLSSNTSDQTNATLSFPLSSLLDSTAPTTIDRQLSQILACAKTGVKNAFNKLKGGIGRVPQLIKLAIHPHARNNTLVSIRGKVVKMWESLTSRQKTRNFDFPLLKSRAGVHTVEDIVVYM